ncbi:uncharacterized protein M437DRAFT_68233 [Aureobasidium melanogenum CBS 110374]|uniref:Uncharacterized protein n=1 Tax=Aureobasidium melanogenum (strain CBS 110374) TaxID=1043003 RepID=A0A074VMH5_AURM1|nr:uncharacterized protein M437DRAFT_68233 [Aureobasidium melanogenum CBS 110374]KEQ60319.1 hypothetical protein M437DRAFT_68233 [Aureobasidium melanogenum CBS 110374]
MRGRMKRTRWDALFVSWEKVMCVAERKGEGEDSVDENSIQSPVRVCWAPVGSAKNLATALARLPASPQGKRVIFWSESMTHNHCSKITRSFHAGYVYFLR